MFSLFKKKMPENGSISYETKEQLPEATLRLIDKSEKMIKEVERNMKENPYVIDWTGKLTLRDNIEAVRKALEQINKGPITDEKIRKLWTADTCLKTVADNLFNIELDF